jgi:hypothetical protein
MTIAAATGPATPVMSPSCVVEATVVEVGPVISFEVRPVVLKVCPVPVMAIPCRVVVIDVTGVFGLANCGRCIVSAVIGRCGLIVYGVGLLVDRCGLFIHRGRGRVNGSRCDVDPGAWNTETDMRIDIYLGIAVGSNETGGHGSGDH